MKKPPCVQQVKMRTLQQDLQKVTELINPYH